MGLIIIDRIALGRVAIITRQWERFFSMKRKKNN